MKLLNGTATVQVSADHALWDGGAGLGSGDYLGGLMGSQRHWYRVKRIDAENQTITLSEPVHLSCYPVAPEAGSSLAVGRKWVRKEDLVAVYETVIHP
jgi:hypothetical protein